MAARVPASSIVATDGRWTIASVNPPNSRVTIGASTHGSTRRRCRNAEAMAAANIVKPITPPWMSGAKTLECEVKATKGRRPDRATSMNSCSDAPQP